MIRSLLPMLAAASLFTAFAACDDDAATTPPDGDGGLTLPDGGANDGATSGDTGSGADSGGDGGADAEAPLVPDWYIDPATGADTNDGKTAATPFKTLCKVKDVALANHVIGLRDGVYGNISQRPPGWTLNPPCSPIFNVPVRIVALNAGQAIVQVDMTLAQGGEIRGVKMQFETLDSGSIQNAQINATGGELVVRDLTVGEIFSQPAARAAPLVVTGAKVTMIPGAVTNYTTVPVPALKALAFAFVNAPGELTVEGGTFDDTPPANADTYCNPLFEGSGKLTLNNVTIRHKGKIIRAGSGATVNVTGGTLEDRATQNNISCLPLIELLSGPTVTLTNTTLSGGARVGIGTEPLSGGTLTLAGVTLSGFTQEAIDLNSNAGAPLALSVRGSTITGNDIGIRVAGAVTADLGTAASPGGNTITGNTTRGVASSSTNVVNAVGNTWIANEQSAGPMGKYPGTLPSALQTGPVTTGLNFSLTSAAQSIQF